LFYGIIQVDYRKEHGTMKRELETIATWNTKNGEVKATFCNWLNLAIWHNGRLAGCNLSVEKAQEIANEKAGEAIWTA